MGINLQIVNHILRFCKYKTKVQILFYKIANNKLFPNIIAANVIITKITALLNLTQNI